jgi:hypothetical protein
MELGGYVDGEKRIPFDKLRAGSRGRFASVRTGTEKMTIFAVAEKEWKRLRRLPKRMGELSEAAFLLKASSLGLGVAKPWGESERYDFIVSGRTGTMWRVQVKSTACRYGRGWSANSSCSVEGAGSEYSAEDVDFLVVHVRPVEAWYVLPVREFAPRRHLNFYPETGRGKWERFREAWELFRPGSGSGVS